MRIVFAGTPDFAAGHLLHLLDNTLHDIIAVFTQPDRPAGRGKKLSASPVKALALKHNLTIYQPPSLRDATIQEQIAQLAPDVMIVVAYGLILPKAVLSIPRLGCLNVHASLLPRWRGAAPIQRAIEAGDSESGITIMQMDEGLDTGPMLFKARCSITANETGRSLHDKLMELGCPSLANVLNLLEDGNIKAETQPAINICYAAKITKAEACLDWRLSAEILERKVRAFNPFPAAYFQQQGNPVRVWQAVAITDKTNATPGTITHATRNGIDVETGDGTLRLTHLQLPGGKLLSAAEILNGHHNDFLPGKQLG